MIVGNLTRDPEVRETSNGKTVVEMTLALDPPGGGKRHGERAQDRGAANDTTIFVDVVLWERTAENAAEYLRKGSPVLIEGRLRMDSWEDRETGKIRRKLKVAGERMRFISLGSRAEQRNHERFQDRGRSLSTGQQHEPTGAGR
jgi:single-strand DNA-binding protein